MRVYIFLCACVYVYSMCVCLVHWRSRATGCFEIVGERHGSRGEFARGARSLLQGRSHII